MRKSLGFTLAEVLITLAIIGVVAAMTIPSVIVNTNQQEFKTGLKKAVSVLNQAITMNMALDGVRPTDIKDTETDPKMQSLLNYFKSRLNVIQETTALTFGKDKNAAFYTSDGMRFEFPTTPSAGTIPNAVLSGDNQECTAARPCLVVVDVNGDKRPSPADPTKADPYAVPDATSTRISDVFTIMITDTSAIPFGAVAQRTMFQND